MTSASPPPRLAVHVGRDVVPELTALLTAATPWADVVAAAAQEPLPPGVQAHLYTSDVLPRRPTSPYAVWRSAGATEVGAAPTVVVAAVGDPAAAPDDLLVSLLPWPEHARQVLPFPRSRFRALRGLPDTLVTEATPGGITWGEPGRTPARAPEAGWPTLAALSSAVIAEGDLVWAALAWAAPVVTDPETARRLSLVPDEHVLVGDDPAERRRLATALATDLTRAAGLARRGWAAVRRRRPERAAEELCGRLGLGPRRDVPAAARLTSALDALGTPRDSLVRRRAREATAVLPGAVTSGWRPAERSST